MAGEEASFIVVSDGAHVLSLATSQDHKRIGDGDTGPNTGGMGAYSPAPVVTPNVHARVMHEIIQPTLAGMAARRHAPFTGFLYAGLMIDAQWATRARWSSTAGSATLEAQVILMRLKSDLFEVLMHATDGTLDQVELTGTAAPRWRGDGRRRLPDGAAQGDAISGARPVADDLKVFHAGTTRTADAAHGRRRARAVRHRAGRLVPGAAARLRWRCSTLRFDGAQWRSDIGHRAIRQA